MKSYLLLHSLTSYGCTPKFQKPVCRYAAQSVVGSDKPPVSLPRSTYQLFMRQSASEILAKHPEVNTLGDRSKLLAAEWKKVSSEDKARCVYAHD